MYVPYKEWVPVQGEEVQVRFEDNYIDIAKFIEEAGNATSVVKIGKKRYVVPNYNISQNCPAYKKVKQEKDERVVTRKSRRDDDEKEFFGMDW